MRANVSWFTVLAISEIKSKCGAVNCILIDSIFITKRRTAADPSVRHAVGHCDCCSPGEKNFPALFVATSFSGQADLTRSLLLESPPLFAGDSGPLRAHGASLEGTGSRSAQSISVRRAIDCARGRRWWASILTSARWGTFDSQHMAGRVGSVMRGHRQLVGGMEAGPQGWMKALGGLLGSPARRC